MIELYATTQEQADKLWGLITTTTKVADYSSSIYDIVNEQTPAFFSGQKSAEEVARLIQNKANIYVNERGNITMSLPLFIRAERLLIQLRCEGERIPTSLRSSE